MKARLIALAQKLRAALLEMEAAAEREDLNAVEVSLAEVEELAREFVEETRA